MIELTKWFFSEPWRVIGLIVFICVLFAGAEDLIKASKNKNK